MASKEDPAPAIDRPIFGGQSGSGADWPEGDATRAVVDAHRRVSVHATPETRQERGPPPNPDRVESNGADGQRRTRGAELDALESEVEALRAELAALRGDAIHGDARRLLELTVGTHTVEIGRLSDGLDELKALEPAVESVEAETLALRDAHDSLESSHRELEADFGTFTDTIEAEFSSLRVILEHLVERARTAEREIDELEERLARRHADGRGPGSLIEAAVRIGIRAAECGSCGREIDLGPLSEPTCPECGEPFDGIRRRRKWFGLATTYELAPASGSPD